MPPSFHVPKKMAAASGVGNPVYYVGAKTGRDGIHGATMASAEFDDKSAEKRPAVQVGDPFMEKLLMEACLEVMKTGALVGIQDMGAAGLTCSTSEMGSRGGHGMTIDVMHVPQRESGMVPYEIMLSESQERMLMVVHKGREREVQEVFEKWDLHAVKIGVVTDGSIRDLEQCAEGFRMLAGSIGPSHAFVHVEEFGIAVTVAGMTVRPGDLVHADRHGAVVIPAEAARAVPEAAAVIARREALLLAAARAPGFTVKALEEAMRAGEDIH